MNQQIVVSENALGYLRSTSPWVKFLAVVGFVVTAFIVLIGLFMFAVGGLAPPNSKFPASLFPVLGVIYLVLGLFFYLIPSILLMRYGSAITRIPNSGQEAIDAALRNQKTFWKYVGIFMIIMIVAYVIFLICAMALGFFAATHLP
jgi:hypothetical protein